MPIHEQGYRRYSGRRLPAGRRWWVIARVGVLARLRDRRFLALLLLAWAPFGVRAIQIYIASSFTQVSFLAPTTETFREFLDQQSLFVFFVTIYAGAGLIADDRRAHALQIYLSKPLTRIEYVAGKTLILLIFLGAVTWVPAIALMALQVVFAGSTAFIRENAFLLPAVTAFCGVQALVSAVAMLALSSLSTSRRFVGVLYAGFVFFAAAVYQMLRVITDSGIWAVLSPEDVFDALADALFGTAGASGLPLSAAAAALVTLVAGSTWILARRVRAGDVIT